MNDPFFADIAALKRQADISSRPGQGTEIKALAAGLRARYERQLENYDALQLRIHAALALHQLSVNTCWCRDDPTDEGHTHAQCAYDGQAWPCPDRRALTGDTDD